MDERQIEDLARGAFEEAMSFGVSFDVFHRMAKTVAAAERAFWRNAAPILIVSRSGMETTHEAATEIVGVVADARSNRD